MMSKNITQRVFIGPDSQDDISEHIDIPNTVDQNGFAKDLTTPVFTKNVCTAEHIMVLSFSLGFFHERVPYTKRIIAPPDIFVKLDG